MACLLESDKEPNKINESPLEAKLNRLLKVLDEIKPQVDRFRLIEALTSKSEMNLTYYYSFKVASEVIRTKVSYFHREAETQSAHLAKPSKFDRKKRIE